MGERTDRPAYGVHGVPDIKLIRTDSPLDLSYSGFRRTSQVRADGKVTTNILIHTHTHVRKANRSKNDKLPEVTLPFTRIQEGKTVHPFEKT